MITVVQVLVRGYVVTNKFCFSLLTQSTSIEFVYSAVCFSFLSRLAKSCCGFSCVAINRLLYNSVEFSTHNDDESLQLKDQYKIPDFVDTKRFYTIRYKHFIGPDGVPKSVIDLSQQKHVIYIYCNVYISDLCVLVRAYVEDMKITAHAFLYSYVRISIVKSMVSHIFATTSFSLYPHCILSCLRTTFTTITIKTTIKTTRPREFTQNNNSTWKIHMPMQWHCQDELKTCNK